MKRLSRLLFLIAVLLVVGGIGHRDLGATPPPFPYDDECFCDFRGASYGVYFFDDDFTYRGESKGSTDVNMSGVGSAAFFCENSVCDGYGKQLGASFCSSYGPGHKIELEFHWYFYDLGFIDNGGSGDGFDIRWYECA